MSGKEWPLKIRGFVLHAEQHLANADISDRTSNLRVGEKKKKSRENYIFLKNSLLLPLYTLYERKYICQLVYIYFLGNTHNLHICGEFVVNSHNNQDVNVFTGLK